MAKEKREITKRQLGKIVKNAFERGEKWGVTYSTWFTPEVGDTKKEIEKAKKLAYKTLKI